MTVRWRVTKLSPLHFKIEHLYGKWKIIVEVSLIQKNFTLGMDIWVLDLTGRIVDNQPRNTREVFAINPTWNQSRTTSRFSTMARKQTTKTIKKARITSEYPRISTKN